MPKLKITVGHCVVHVEAFDTSTAKAVAAAAPFESRAATWQGEVYFQVPVPAVERDDGARDVVERGEIAFRTEGEMVVIGYAPTPCSEGGEIRLASPSNIWGRTDDDLAGLSEVEAGQLVRVELVE